MPGVSVPRRSPVSGRTWFGPLVAAVAALVLLLAACGDDDDARSAPDAADSAAAADSADGATDGPAAGGAIGDPEGDGATGDPEGDGATGDEPAATRGDHRGTVEIDGQVHELSLDPSIPYSQCAIVYRGASVYGMIAPGGIELSLSGGDVWSATLLVSGTEWVAASDDPPPGSDATLEISTKNAVIAGTWGSEDGSGRTAEIRVELDCP